jgi:predicted RNA-binding protein with PIN domain
VPLVYYIDGYNVIHFCSQLKPLAMENFEAARDALVERVARFCAVTGETAKIVFDGRGRQADPTLPLCGTPGLEVIYSPRSQSADAYIEREAYMTSRRGDMVVVSGDSGIRTLCRGLGTLTMEPDNFLGTIEERLESERLGRDATQTGYTRHTVEDRLDEASRDRLRELRDNLEKQS